MPESKSSNLVARIVQIVVIVSVLGVIAYFAVRFVLDFAWWIFAFISLGVLFINRDFLMRGYEWLRKLGQRNIWLGLGAGLGLILAFTPFLGFLYLKTIWDFFRQGKGDKKIAQKQEPEVIEITPIEEDEENS